jgi:hypothetical protein
MILEETLMHVSFSRQGLHWPRPFHEGTIKNQFRGERMHSSNYQPSLLISECSWAQSGIERKVRLHLNFCLLLRVAGFSIFISTAFHSPALAQRSYQGIWSFEMPEAVRMILENSESKPQAEVASIPENKRTHGIDFKQSQGSMLRPLSQPTAAPPSETESAQVPEPSISEEESRGWFPPPNPPRRDQGHPAPFKEEAKIKWLIPSTPSEESFTSPKVGTSSESVPSESFESPGWSESNNRHQKTRSLPTGNPHEAKVTESQPGEPRGQDLQQARGASTLENIETVNFEHPDSSTLGLSHRDPVAKAQAIIASFKFTDDPISFPGRPVRLIDMIRQPIAIQRRAEMVGQYWSAWNRGAELKSRIEYSQWLTSLNESPSPYDREFFSTAKSTSEKELMAAKNEFNTAQTQLQSYFLVKDSFANALPSLPIPSDVPLVHEYVTHYQLYNQYRPLPARFQNIDQALSRSLQFIAAQASNVEIAKSTAENQLDLYRSGRGNLQGVIEAGQKWRIASNELINSAANYNLLIADYALNITDGTQTPETVVAMLIGREETLTETAKSPSSSSFASEERPRIESELAKTDFESNRTANIAPQAGWDFNSREELNTPHKNHPALDPNPDPRFSALGTAIHSPGEGDQERRNEKTAFPVNPKASSRAMDGNPLQPRFGAEDTRDKNENLGEKKPSSDFAPFEPGGHNAMNQPWQSDSPPARPSARDDQEKKAQFGEFSRSPTALPNFSQPGSDAFPKPLSPPESDKGFQPINPPENNGSPKSPVTSDEGRE